ncbi:MAG: hypothetical protein QF890_00490 [Myxococcota bacterium]|jgi:hypothetical protein|nr:hypothetical protein [Deltaproteobacteria bacterium]MCP4239912.1 hypothetical protein [bacterium]MDP6073937.1 hypothetical protein [Myxococcota bacterium]MDP6242935.1 hypothetical protein [Myxococcota bacterium]MDP7076592.1 hypothetical protein [Myxococcota bacterium]
MGDTVLGLASLAVVAISIRFWIRALKRVEIPQNRGGFVAAWVVAAGLGVTALAGEPGWLGGISAGFAVFASMFFLFTVAIGGQKVGEGAIRVGATIPAFTATDEHGQTFDSHSLTGHPVLIKFFRAHW